MRPAATLCNPLHPCNLGACTTTAPPLHRLCSVLRELGNHGKRDFYTGRAGAAIVAALQRQVRARPHPDLTFALASAFSLHPRFSPCPGPSPKRSGGAAATGRRHGGGRLARALREG